MGPSPGPNPGPTYRVVREVQRTFRTGDVERSEFASGLCEEEAGRISREEISRALREDELAFFVVEPETSDFIPARRGVRP